MHPQGRPRKRLWQWPGVCPDGHGGFSHDDGWVNPPPIVVVAKSAQLRFRLAAKTAPAPLLLLSPPRGARRGPLVRSCRKENGPWTVQKKRTLAQTCTYVQVCLNTKVFRIVSDEDKKSSAGRDPLRQSRFSASAADTPAETSGRSRIPCPPGPAAAPPAFGEPPESLRSRAAMSPSKGTSNESYST